MRKSTRIRTRILIAIPVYNEQKFLDLVLDKVLRFHPDVLVIDDGSTDGTTRALAARKDVRVIRHATNKGYGRSLIDAFNYADEHGFDWVITMDCDEQHEPEMIPEFLREIRSDRWDIVSGSRYLAPRKDDDLPPGDRRQINANITDVINRSLGLKLTDAFCGFKAQRVSAIKALDLTEEGYAFPMQLWPRAALRGLRDTEIPVKLIYNDPTRHFGGKLDDAAFRLRHYLDVLGRELEAPVNASTPAPEPASCEAAPVPVEMFGCCCG